jgi:hypothetical protein
MITKSWGLTKNETNVVPINSFQFPLLWNARPCPCTPSAHARMLIGLFARFLLLFYQTFLFPKVINHVIIFICFGQKWKVIFWNTVCNINNYPSFFLYLSLFLGLLHRH